MTDRRGIGASICARYWEAACPQRAEPERGEFAHRAQDRAPLAVRPRQCEAHVGATDVGDQRRRSGWVVRAQGSSGAQPARLPREARDRGPLRCRIDAGGAIQEPPTQQTFGNARVLGRTGQTDAAGGQNFT